MDVEENGPEHLSRFHRQMELRDASAFFQDMDRTVSTLLEFGST